MTDNKMEIPEEFSKVIRDFVNDMRVTFPEYSSIINKWWKDTANFDSIEDEEERKKTIEQSEKTSISILFNFCKKKYPPRFFEILYQNDEMFTEDSSVDTEFLPHIHFKDLWQFDITEKTREAIWKYLQLILFSIVNTIENKEMFGDTAKLFESINEDEFKSKLEETFTKMQDIFNQKNDENTNENTNTNTFGSNINMEDLPNADDIHERLTGMLDGKLGKLAKEIAEETAQNLDIDMENVSDMKDVFNNLIKNPNKLMGLVKSVGEKLDTRIKSGEMKESELIAEATELMNKMKNMPGMDGIQSMLGKMGGVGNMGGLGKGAKMNYGAMEAELDKKMRIAKMKERMKSKSEMNNMMKETQAKLQEIKLQTPPAVSEEEIISLFTKGDAKTDKSTKNQNQNQNQTGNKNKKKKSKK
jgi:hypothetical protein